MILMRLRRSYILVLFGLIFGLTRFPVAQQSSEPKAHRAAPNHSSGPAETVSFVDVTKSAVIDFRLTCGGPEKRYIMESMCGGVAVLDYDNDGWMDIFLVNGSTLEDLKTGKCHASKLYHNNHDGTFSDVTAKSGINHCGWGFGAAVGDYDNDGHEDLYITYLDGAVLYHNNGDGTFTDVTAKAGVGNAGRWGTSAAFGDYDNDGYLDLFVDNYVDLDLNHLPALGESPFCSYRGIAVSCGPRGLSERSRPPLPQQRRRHFYRRDRETQYRLRLLLWTRRDVARLRSGRLSRRLCFR